MADNSCVIAHRCDHRPDGYGIRYLTSRCSWYLMRAEYSYDWDNWLYWPVVPISFCPFCGIRLDGKQVSDGEH